MITAIAGAKRTDRISRNDTCRWAILATRFMEKQTRVAYQTNFFGGIRRLPPSSYSGSHFRCKYGCNSGDRLTRRAFSRPRDLKWVSTKKACLLGRNCSEPKHIRIVCYLRAQPDCWWGPSTLRPASFRGVVWKKRNGRWSELAGKLSRKQIHRSLGKACLKISL
jgi:hypothetical protein